MKGLFKTKKGVSPLITTILLIAFAVALGVVVMNWGKTTASKLNFQCPEEVSLQIAQVASKQQICIDKGSGKLKFTLENGKDHGIEKIHAQALAENDIMKFDLEEPMDKGSLERFNVDFNSVAYGKIIKITFKPYVQFPESEDLKDCPDNMLVVEFGDGLKDC